MLGIHKIIEITIRGGLNLAADKPSRKTFGVIIVVVQTIMRECWKKKKDQKKGTTDNKNDDPTTTTCDGKIGTLLTTRIQSKIGCKGD